MHQSLEQMLSIDPSKRMSVQQFFDGSYLNDITMRSIVYLSALAVERKEVQEKTAFFTGLAGVIPNVPKRVLHSYVSDLNFNLSPKSLTLR